MVGFVEAAAVEGEAAEVVYNRSFENKRSSVLVVGCTRKV